jgi:fructose-bisphosphate aldolase class II
LDALPEGAQVTEELMTKVDEAKAFMEQTGADMLAPAVGNVHGMVKGGDPKLSISRIAEISAAVGKPLVLHGGSGNSNEEFINSVKNGIAIIHINTELRLAYREGLVQSLAHNPDETTPYKFVSPAVSHMKDFLVQKIRLFAGQ